MLTLLFSMVLASILLIQISQGRVRDCSLIGEEIRSKEQDPHNSINSVPWTAASGAEGSGPKNEERCLETSPIPKGLPKA